jgi:rhamnose utilization protein RhaD (predicted bifunctional aldolase and dehydrogenase)
MKNLFDENVAKEIKTDLAIRVYTSNILGKSDELVLHGGGNTSVKSVVNGEDILYVKGSGWDLVSIKEEGFAPVKMTTLLEMAKLESLSDSDMVKGQKDAMIDKSAPNPSVEAILHAIIPFKYVDHTHADAVVTISNSVNGKKHIEDLYQDYLIVNYIMPGFILAKEIYNLTFDFDWSKCKGIILLNHGIFTFDDDAKKSYDKMIEAVSVAEEFLENNAKVEITKVDTIDYDIPNLEKVLKDYNDKATIFVDTSDLAKYYSSQENLKEFATRGILTPEHIIRTKRVPLIIDKDSTIIEDIEDYIKDYITYFDTFVTNEQSLSPLPKYIVIKDYGVVSVGNSQKEAKIISDIVSHTMMAVLRADKLGGFVSLSLSDCFAMEYWELEQAKLKK